MRLFKPPFSIESSTALRSDSDLGNTFSLSGLLTLPKTPGETYLGQHFNAFVRITNTHSRPLKSVKLTVELVTPRVRHVFKDKRVDKMKTNPKNQPVELAVDAGLDIVIEHLLVEQGTHRLRVTVSYVWPETGVSDTCIKQYPVKVEKPISVNLRTRRLPGSSTAGSDSGGNGNGNGNENGGTTLVEAQLQNTTSENVLLDTVRFAPSPGFTATNLGIEIQAEDHSCLLNVQGLDVEEIGQVGSIAVNDSAAAATATTTTTTTGGSVSRPPSSPIFPSSLIQRIISNPSLQQEQERLLLRPSQVHRYLYAVAPEKNSKTTTETKVGRISMVWKTTMGETARLQTALIEREIPPRLGVELSIRNCPTSMVLGNKYTLHCALINHTSAASKMQVDFGNGVKGGGIVVSGCSCKIFDAVVGGQTDFHIDVVPLEAGLQSFGTSVTLKNMSSGQPPSSVGTLAEIFVTGG